MANISRIVNPQIALATQGIRQQQFSDLLLVGVHTGAARVSIITTPDDLITDSTYGLTTSSPLYLAAQAVFSQTPSVPRCFIGRRASGETFVAALNACRQESREWYAFIDVTNTPADILLGAPWAESNEKLQLATLFEAADLTSGTTGTAYSLKQGNYLRTFWMHGNSATDFTVLGEASKQFTKYPGADDWFAVKVSNAFPVNITEGEFAFLKAKNGNSYETFNEDFALTQGGKTAGGEWMDVIRFRDWLCEEIRIRVFRLFIDRRINYTNAGIGLIEQAIRGALELGRDRGGVAPEEYSVKEDRVIPSFVIRVPNSVDVSPNDKANRLLQDVSFEARLSGAIHAVVIRGTLTYDNIG